MKTHFKRIFSTIIQAFLVVLIHAETIDSLLVNFRNPPSNTKPWVYWYWTSDNISKEGISKDLEAMAKVGIGEAFIGNVDVIEQKGAVKALTENWWQMMEHAIREGKRTGVDIGIFNSPGWSQSGGPWNMPEHAMRYLTMSETKVKGPLKIALKLPKPNEQFQDVAVIAFSTPLSDTDYLSTTNSNITSTPSIADLKPLFDGNAATEIFIPQNSFTINFECSAPYTARSITLNPSHTGFNATCELMYKQVDGTFKSFKTFSIARSNTKTQVGFLPFAPISETFDAVTSSHFRLVITKEKGKVGFTEISFSAAARVERYAEKQLAKLWQTPAPLWDAYMWKQPSESNKVDLNVNPQKVLNISEKMNNNGVLEWNVPAGEWIIQRIGMTPTGEKNHPASVEATGLEIDKMNRECVAGHFDAYIGEILKRMPAADRTAFKHVVADSYETGAQNWTDGLAADFTKQFGYNPIPYLPVIMGRVVGNADLSERFLWDLRRMIADRISYHYVGGLRDKSNKEGLKLWLENYGHWGYPGEFLQYGGQSDEVGGEFWAAGNDEGIELRAASSAAHGYGKNIVHSEAFTSMKPAWTTDPWSLKKRGDWAATKGINHFVFHVYVHQPTDDKVPGINSWFGVEYNRHNTWFYQSKEWVDYFRSTHYLLQQGKYVADVAYFIGEDAPKMTGIRNPELPEGYSFDYVNAEVIEKMDIKNKHFVLPDGMTYSILVLPPQSTMRPAVLAKIKQLIAKGGTVVGTPPTHSPSLQNYPECDKQIKQMAKEIWGKCDGVNSKKINFGNGLVYNGASLTEVFNGLNIIPDIANIDEKSFPWIHRSTPDAEIYYISNQKDQNTKFTPSFRVTGLQPELWNPITKEQRDLPDFKIENGKTIVPLEFAARESYFVVFRKKANDNSTKQLNFVPKKTIGKLSGSWTVYFDKKWGAPDSVEFLTLEDWTKRPETGIKFYSGTARYLKSFDAPAYKEGTSVYLNLGIFKSLAVVKLNGHSLGLVWAEPHIVDISKFLIAKNNVLEIEVTNTWNNRIIGDATLTAENRLTYTTYSSPKNAPLMPSGLIGPVAFQIDDPELHVPNK